ncbi:hypothetical protein LTR47_006602 [Exophiala xenobiotica]|nr:hypothetical protein LTR47_006602 [Exophiala xenobiotica]KAK5280589.1 hypothetical protein LTR40_006140 [Exophiala xenobiotica]KAK5349057.1 hypothetical protein LTR61_007095 [Exophiala xenobiotica]KAK5365547.1 hypothetical protein LTR11_008429 [Exophiala xenobiotica]KAK5372713.1 hypothetical protein LTS03_006401 [Exophiala xenobiotica]
MFIKAHNGSSQERLNVTSQMMNDILTYHQIMPPFVDLMASFGRNAADDYQYCGFRSEARLSVRNAALAVPELDRSGQVLEICYSLRAAEPSTSIPGWPWSIKQLAIAHTFDIQTGQSAWVVLKADNLIKDRIMSATRSAGLPDMNSYQDVDESLASSLASHLVFCEWAAEHWRWYVNFLEQQVQDITGTTTFSNITAPSSLRAAQRAVSRIAPAARSGTFPFARTLSRISTWGSIRRNSRPSKGSDSDVSGSTVSPNGAFQSGAAEAITEKDVEEEEEEDGEEHSFSLKDIQRLQFIENKINEAMLVQTTIIKVLEQLRRFYTSLQEHPEWRTGLSRECKGSLARFNSRLANIEFDLNLQFTRAETLGTLLANRKTLLGQIMEWRSTEAIKMISKQSHTATKHMESMTDEMRELAVKTKQETVSMRIITLVTLFFLPGTFISTLMSTDIVQYDHSKEIFSMAALKMFLAISLPMMFLTFVAWYAVYWYVNNRERVQKLKNQMHLRGDSAA